MAVDDFVICKSKTTDMQSDKCRQIATSIRGWLIQIEARSRTHLKMVFNTLV